MNENRSFDMHENRFRTSKVLAKIFQDNSMQFQTLSIELMISPQLPKKHFVREQTQARRNKGEGGMRFPPHFFPRSVFFHNTINFQSKMSAI